MPSCIADVGQVADINGLEAEPPRFWARAVARRREGIVPIGPDVIWRRLIERIH